MFNDRDSYTNFKLTNDKIIKIPYEIGTIVELKDNSGILARICQYRVCFENNTQVIKAGLTTNIYDENAKIEGEIICEKLVEKWKKTNKILINSKPEYFANQPKLQVLSKVKKIKIK